MFRNSLFLDMESFGNVYEYFISGHGIFWECLGIFYFSTWNLLGMFTNILFLDMESLGNV
jgi:hypothetical protein